MTNRAVRRVHRLYDKALSRLLFNKILRANERLASEHSIDQHVIEGLNNALRNEKEPRQRGKRLKLLGEEEPGARFFSPSKIQAARARLKEQETEKLQKQRDID